MSEYDPRSRAEHMPPPHRSKTQGFVRSEEMRPNPRGGALDPEGQIATWPDLSHGHFGTPAPAQSSAQLPIFPENERTDPAIVFAGPGYTSMPLPANGVATVALWLAPPAIVLFPLAVIVLILGIVGVIVAQGQQGYGKNRSIAAIITSTLTLLLWLLLFILF
ncbi:MULTISPECIES: hypothetical protein [unclassified Schaalia]|uniref:hypothetical protein n=1 Tax=unclassified Schaalia TaxID=2691889 RepID=UPI001E2A8AD5|nr:MULTISPECIES: hypothetical protein [unclassified Schaalia]MCD4548849.1 hypothetical protein [Schaalia sp. lx-260]MCD4557465.1 hypothetical protein [Schaalia sp. lx-100]